MSFIKVNIDLSNNDFSDLAYVLIIILIEMYHIPYSASHRKVVAKTATFITSG